MTLVNPELGATYREIHTGKTGVAFCTAQYLTGCDRIGVYLLREDGSYETERNGDLNTRWFDLPFAELVKGPDSRVVEASRIARGDGVVVGGRGAGEDPPVR